MNNKSNSGSPETGRVRASKGQGKDLLVVTVSFPRSVVDDPVKEEKGGEGGPRCKVCSGTKNRNKGGKPEPLIICGNCKSASKFHASCKICITSFYSF